MQAGNGHQTTGVSIVSILVFRFLPYWPHFVAALVAGFLLATAYLKLATPMYEISAVVLIKDEKKGVEDPTVIESLNAYATKKIVENEIEVVRSRRLIRQSVEQLGLFSPVFEVLPFKRKHSAYETSAVIPQVKFLNKPFTVGRHFYFTYDSASKTIVLEGVNYKIDEWRRLGDFNLRFVQNPNLVQEGSGPFYFDVLDPRAVAADIAKRMEILATSKLGTVITLKLRDEVPVRGEQILNSIVEFYNRGSAFERSALAATTLHLIEERIKNVESSLDSVERSIEAYKSNRGIVNLTEQGKLFLQNVGDNDQRLTEIEMQLAVLAKIEKYITTRNSGERLLPSSVGLTDPRLATSVQRLFEAEVKYETLKRTTAENNPILVALRDEIDNLRPSILENVKNQRIGLLASKEKVTSSNTHYESVLGQIPQKERELLEVNRQQSIKNDVYTYLLQKREETALAYASSVSDATLIDAAESSLGPVAPNRMIVYAGAFIASFVVALAFVCFKEVVTNRVLFRKDIESLTRLPILGEVSHARYGHKFIFDSTARSPVREQFRQLRSAIRMVETDPHTIMVTSSVSNEGKSFVSSNLANSLSRLGKRVLLIDFDLRNSRLTHLFGLAGSEGMSDLITGKASLRDVIRETSLPSLHIIAAGKTNGSSTEMLMCGPLQALFEKLREQFDYVILDSPPILPIADAFIVGAFAEMTLFVVRHGKTMVQMVQSLESNDRLGRLKNVQIVFNDIKPRGSSRLMGYGFGYGGDYYRFYSDSAVKAGVKIPG